MEVRKVVKKKKKSIYDDRWCPKCRKDNICLCITENKRLCNGCGGTHQLEMEL